MSRCLFSHRRVPARTSPAVLLVVIVLLSGLISSAFGARIAYVKSAPPKVSPSKIAAMKAAATPGSQGPGPQRIWLAEPQRVQLNHVPAAGIQNLLAPAGPDFAASQPQPLSMVNGDFDGDGIEDLVVGYATPGGGAIALHHGNLDAFAPQSQESWLAIGQGRFPQPYLPYAHVSIIPIRPDFVVAGRFVGSDQLDLVVGSKGGNVLYLLEGDGTGNFGKPQIINLPGGVDALGAGVLGTNQRFSSLLVGTSGGQGSSLFVYRGTENGLVGLSSYRLGAPVSNINFGEFDQGISDAAFLSGGQVFVLRSFSSQLARVTLPLHADAMVLGSFVLDRMPGLQIALLASDGSIQIAAHNEFDPRPYTAQESQAIRRAVRVRSEPNPLLPIRTFPVNGWKIVESIPSAAPFSAGQPPVLFRTRISSTNADDIMAFSNITGQMSVISHPDLKEGANTFIPGQVSTRYYPGSVVAGLPMRVNPDGRAGAVMLHQGEAIPYYMGPLPDPTFFPNRFDDITPRGTGVTCLNTSAVDGSMDCTLREAIIKANATAGTDTIMLQAGTYTLSLARNAGDHSTSLQGTLEVQDSLNIIGMGPSSTFVQGGTTLANSVDKVFSFNQDIDSFTNATVSISNFTIQNGHNRGDCCATQDGFGGAFDFDTGGTGGTPGTGNANLFLTNMTIQNNAIFDGQGGGFTIFNTNSGSGTATIVNTIIQNNSGTPNATGGVGDGGGVVIDARAKIIITNGQITNNQAKSNAGTNANGGGLALFGQHTQPQSAIHATVISNNTAAGTGGGMFTNATLLVDQGTVIDQNTAGNGGANGFGGGGIINNSADGLTLSKVSINNNSTTGNGGGIFTGNTSGGVPITMSFSRLAGNSSTLTPGSSNLYNLQGTITVTNNWWATNTPSTTITTNAGTTNFTPWINLTHTANPTLLRIGDTSALTADFLHRNTDPLNSPSISASSLDVFSGLPVTFNNNAHGNISSPQPFIETQVNIANSPGGATESGCTTGPCTATITTTAPHGFSPGQNVRISGVGVLGYNGIYAIVATPTTTTFTYSNPVGGLANSGGGTASVPTGKATASYTATSGGIDHVHAVVDGFAANVDITVLFPPSISKIFGAASIPVFTFSPTTTTLTFTITNPNTANSLNGLAFTDNLPSGLQVADTTTTNTCGGTLTGATAGSTSISLSGGTVTFNAGGTATCTVTVDVKGVTDGVQNNTSGNVTATDAGGLTGNFATASITVINPPTISKSFSPTSIPLNGTSTLTFTITNSNVNTTLTGVQVADILPAGLTVATNSSTVCGGTLNTTNPTSISLTGATIAPGGQCQFSVTVTGAVAGQYTNTTGNVSSSNGGTGNTATANLTVVGPPTISKSFSPKSIPLNSNSTLSFTVTNPNTFSTLSGVAFTDSLPGGVKLASTTVTGSCGSGTITATINNPPGSPSTVSLSGGTLTASPAAGSSCTFSVSVTGITAGAQVNTTSTVSSTEGGTGGTASDTLVVVAPPTISKSFSPKTIPLNSNSTLSFTVTNPNTASALSGVAFTDSLPGGVKLASTTVTGSCGSGTITATINNPPGTPSTVSLSGGTLTASPAAGSSCTFSVSVTGISAGTQVNTTSTVSSTEGGTGGTASDTLTVIAPATISKSFSPKSIPLNGNSTLSFTLTNPNTVSALSGVAFTDSLPGGVKLASTTVTGSCGSGTITATINNPPGTPSTVSLSGGTLTASPDPASSCTFSVSVTGISAGAQVNTTGAVSSTEGGTGGTATDTLTVIAPPTIAKSFAPKSIPLNGNSTLSFTLTNPNTASALSGVSFTDTLPGGLQLASTTVTGSCGSGTITATINNPPGTPSTVSLSGGTLAASPAAGSSCTFSVSITGIAAGSQVNTTSTVSSTEGGTGGTATDTITVVAPPTISKAFGATNIALNGTTTVTFTITNPASNTSAENGVAFSDTLTGGLQVASTPGVTNSCGGTVTAAANSTSISLVGGSIATPGSTCTIVVNVTGTQSGTVTNTTGAVSSTNGGTGATSNTATLIVASPATVTKTFAPTKIPLNGTTLLTINITNPNSNVSLTGLSFTDSLPAGLVVASPANLNNTCGGTATATAGSGLVSLSGGTVASSASCAVSVNVQGTTAGDKLNSVIVSSTEGGASTAATATVTVVAPAAINKAFNPTSIARNGTSTITFTISNPNNPGTPANGDLTGVAFSDTLPVSSGAGSATLVVSSTPNVSNTCGGTVTATAGSGVISLSGGSVAHNTSCTLSVDVKGTVEGDGNNTTGAISSTEGGTGTTSNTATLKVVAPPTISKAFGAANITLNGTTTVTFTITNPASNTSAENGVAFSDTLTNGLQVASTPGVTNSCGGTVTAAANTTSISLVGGSIATPGSTCTIVVNVTGTQSGTVTNTTGAVSSTNGGTGATSNTATLIVASPATVTKTFAPTKIALTGTTLLTINITNPNSNVSLTGLSFTDSLPAGLVVASPANLNNTCGGTATATAGSGSVSLSGGTLASSASCAVSVNVQGTTAGDKLNSVTVSSTEGGASTAATATVTVVAPAAINKAFNPTSIARNGTSTITFTISNPNNPGTPANGDLTGVAFSDTLPVSSGAGSATLVVSSTPNVSNTCGGTVTATAGSGVISLSGGSVAHNTSCTLSVDVKGTVEGDGNNTTGAISSTEGGTGTTSNTATLKVVAPPTINKAFGAANITLNGTTTVTFTITNPASNTSAENGVAFSDTLTGGLQVASTPGVTNSCGGTVTAAANTTSISLVGGSIATPGSTCTIVVNVTGTQSGTVTNTTGAVSSTNGGTGATSNTATLTVALAPSITKSFSPTQIPQGGTSTLTFNITNPNTNVPFTGLSFTDSLPAGLVVASTPNLSNTCGGTAAAAAGSGTVSLSGGTLASNASCAVSVSVQGTAAGVLNNSVTVSSNEGGTGNTSQASITVVAPPTIAKNFGAASIPVGGTTSLTFNITNPNSTVSLTNIAFGDSLPTGLSTAPLGVIGSFCGGTVQTGQISGVFFVSLSGGTLPANGSCSFSVNVTGVTPGHKVNTTGVISATESGNGLTATASIDVFGPPSGAKSFTPNVIAPNTNSTLAFTITNPGANPGSLTGVGFTDTFPANLVVATPNGLSGSCGGGTITATAGSGTVSLSGATLAAGASCTFSVNVTGPAGTYNNTTGPITSTNGGNGTPATATLTIANAALSIMKTHVGDFSRGSMGVYTIVVSNAAGAGPTNGTVTVVDTLPNVTHPLTAITMAGAGWTCNVGTLTCTRSDVLLPGSSYPAITLTVNVPVDITANVTNMATVSGGGDPNSHTASDPTHIGPKLQMNPNGSPDLQVTDGGITSLDFTVDSSAGLGAITFSCSGLPDKASCSFNPQSESQLSATVTMTVSAAAGSVAALPRGPGITPPVYAALLPILGLLGFGFRSKKGKATRLRLAMLLAGLLVLLAFVGCGGGSFKQTGTPAGTFQVTVSATSASTGQSASTVVNLTVLSQGPQH